MPSFGMASSAHQRPFCRSRSTRARWRRSFATSSGTLGQAPAKDRGLGPAPNETMVHMRRVMWTAVVIIVTGLIASGAQDSGKTADPDRLYADREHLQSAMDA